MKIRYGFVSNSSSTSFCVFGVEIKNIEKFVRQHITIKEVEKDEPEQIQGCEHRFDRAKAKFCPTCGEPAWLTVDDDEEDIYFDAYEYQDKINKKLGLDLVSDCYEEWYLGVDIEALVNKTRMKSEDKVKTIVDASEKIKKIFPKAKPDWFVKRLIKEK